MNIYDRINKLLKDRGISKKELSEKTSIPYQTLASLFYRQSQNMSLSTIRKLAAFFNVSVDYLVMGEDYMVKERAEAYLTEHNELDYEILRIARLLPIRDKTALLSKAYELEAALSTQEDKK